MSIVRRFRSIRRFVGARVGDYARLTALEWSEWSGSLLQLVCGAIAASLALLFFLGFVSLALIVASWESDWRVATAFLVALGWLVVCGAGATAAWLAVRRMHPFERVRRELTRDVAAVRTVL